MSTETVINALIDRFTSGNDVPVERTHITLDEWEVLFPLVMLTSAPEGKVDMQAMLAEIGPRDLLKRAYLIVRDQRDEARRALAEVRS